MAKSKTTGRKAELKWRLPGRALKGGMVPSSSSSFTSASLRKLSNLLSAIVSEMQSLFYAADLSR